MAVLAVIIPFVMLGVLMALGRYEEWMLPPVQEPDQPEGAALGH